MIEETIQLLGNRGKDLVTGQEGVITSVSFDLFGCIQVILNPGKQPDGKLGDCSWYDRNRIVVEVGERVMPLPAFLGTEHQPIGPELKPLP